jgi:hypothetical protein
MLVDQKNERTVIPFNEMNEDGQGFIEVANSHLSKCSHE